MRRFSSRRSCACSSAGAASTRSRSASGSGWGSRLGWPPSASGPDSPTSSARSKPRPPWGLTLRVVIYRRRVQHETRKNFQLNLFSPDDGHFEYSAVTTNKALGPAALWDFMAGRGAQEKTLAELKGEFALDVVPTNHYGANSAWQQLCVLAHNLLRSFQLDTLATPKPRCRKRTYAYVLRSMRTLRFLLVVRAGRLSRIGNRQVLRLPQNPATETLYERVVHALAA